MGYMWKFCTSVLLAVGLMLPGAAANAADTYPDPSVAIAIDPITCIGQPLPFTGRSSVDGVWTVTYLGQTKTATGKKVAIDFDTKKAPDGKTVTLTAVQRYDGGTLKRSEGITLTTCDDESGTGANRGDGSGLSGILPNTGGISFWIIVLGVALVAAGATTVVRRRQH